MARGPRLPAHVALQMLTGPFQRREDAFGFKLMHELAAKLRSLTRGLGAPSGRRARAVAVLEPSEVGALDRFPE
eukprot:2099837-Pyramimonas_sp.AAC.1